LPDAGGLIVADPDFAGGADSGQREQEEANGRWTGAETRHPPAFPQAPPTLIGMST
jgi:hypothetical protein